MNCDVLFYASLTHWKKFYSDRLLAVGYGKVSKANLRGAW
jgi:hypothetical protein